MSVKLEFQFKNAKMSYISSLLNENLSTYCLET